VAKSGYVFEPPTPVTPLDDPAPAALSTPPPEAADATIGPLRQDASAVARSGPREVVPRARRSAPVRGPRAGRVPRIAAAIALAGLAIAALAGLSMEDGATAATPPQPIEVALIGVGDDAAPTVDGWPARLLHAWLSWKFDLTPRTVRLSESHLASGSTTRTPHLVLISSGTVPGGDTMFVRARIGHGDESREFERRGSAAEMPALVDALSRTVFDAVAPGEADAAWPSLEIEPAAARAYAEAYDAYLARAWPAAADVLSTVVRQAPGFDPARVQLATALSRMGQSLAVRDQLQAMADAPARAPRHAAPVLEAELLALDPRRTLTAAEAFGTLAAAHPHRHDFALRQAGLLALAGRSNEALAILARPAWSRQPTSVRIEFFIHTAQARLGLGDIEQARAAATRALRLAREAGPGWAREHGQILLMLAQVEYALGDGEVDQARFELAARQFELAGSPVNATFARYVGHLLADPDAADGPVLEDLLSKAREGGYLDIEIDLLRNAAVTHYMAGRHDRYRARLEEAVTVATKAENPLWLEQLGLDLLADDVMAADLRSADERIRQLQDSTLQGEAAIAVDEYASWIAGVRGEFPEAMAILDRADRGRDVPRLTAARLACARADLHAQQGRLDKAREALRACAAPGLPELEEMAALGVAWIDLLAGERDAAHRRLETLTAATDPAEGPDAWWTTLQLGYLWTRAGAPDRAEPMFEVVLAPARDAGYDWLVALAETGLAETRVAQRDWARAEEHLARARDHAPDDAWLLTSRIEQAAAAIEFGRGDGDAARLRLEAVHATAHALGDVVAQAGTHALLPSGDSRPPCARDGMLASAGMRGTSFAWLLQAAAPPTAAVDMQASLALPE
jgi:tetratricopeptide (TPR) repeat protein